MMHFVVEYRPERKLIIIFRGRSFHDAIHHVAAHKASVIFPDLFERRWVRGRKWFDRIAALSVFPFAQIRHGRYVTKSHDQEVQVDSLALGSHDLRWGFAVTLIHDDDWRERVDEAVVVGWGGEECKFASGGAAAWVKLSLLNISR
jgi:hypothetical protein